LLTSDLFPFSALTPPIHIIRPFDDVHINCERDIEKFCSAIDIDRTHGLTDVDPNTLSRSQSFSLATEESRTEEEQPFSSFSLGVDINFNPNNSKEPVQRAKNKNRFLNYGANKDTCLWSAFDTAQVSTECASALTYINNTAEYFPIEIENKFEKMKHVSISLSLPAGALISILAYIIFRKQYNIVDDNKEDQLSEHYEHYEHHISNKSEKIAFIAVPLMVI